MIKKRQLGSTAVSLTEVSFGAASIGNLFNELDNAQSVSVINAASEAGIGYFDTAPHYGAGLSERRLGLALSEIKSEDLVLSTKVGRVLTRLPPGALPQDQGFVNEPPMQRTFDYSYDGVMRSFEDSCQRMGTNQIDILLMHDIGEYCQGDKHGDTFKQAMEGGYKAMHELRSQQLVKAIGLGVNEWQVCQQTFDYAEFDCFMVANCLTLLNNDIVDPFLAQCAQRQVGIIAAAPFNSGILATGSKGAGHYFYAEVPGEILQKVKQMEAICERHKVPLGAAALQYPLLFPMVTSVLVGMSSAKRVADNLALHQSNIEHALWLELRDAGLIHIDTPI